MKVGLIGFGKTGKAVASVILLNKEFCLEWVLRKSELLEHRLYVCNMKSTSFRNY
jgi:4-hydroxy-tetrahydrodipicolinate reductase